MIRVHKSINIAAPLEEVYELWSNFENFPRFMTNIEAIQNTGEGRSHWVVKGPAGSKVEFDAIETDNKPNRMIAWATTPESQVKTQGQVQFRDSNGGTLVNVNMAYTPPAGVAGHAVAALFGKDPKTEMDADLARMKTLLEEGKTRANKTTVTREQVLPVTGSQSGPTGQSGNQGRSGGRRSGKNRSGGGRQGSGGSASSPMSSGMDMENDEDSSPLGPNDL